VLGAGHPGRLVKQWTPSAPAIETWYVVTTSLGSAYPTPQQKGCNTGWKYDSSALAVQAPTPPSAAASAKYCLGFLVEAAAAQTLVVVPCDASDQKQQFDYDGNKLRAHNTTVAGKNQYVSVDQWYTGAEVQMGGGGSAVFFDADKGTLNDGTTLPNDVCINISPTAGGGDALQLWAKKQPGGAMAVFLLNNHQNFTYTDVTIELKDVGLDATQAVTVRDIWSKTDKPDATGSIALTVPPRDSAFVLLTPKKLTA
jgi:hypothetical protein